MAPGRRLRSRFSFCAPKRNKPHAPTVGANKTGLTPNPIKEAICKASR
jgi:hypothetical protein